MSESETPAGLQVPRALGSARRRDLACRVAAFGLWIALVVFFLGLAVNQGLSIPDDAFHAVIAKCMARGIGYASTSPSLDREPSQPLRFDPGVGTGPAIILPCAAALKIAGVHDALPGISTIVIWASLMTMLLVLVGREVRGISFLLGSGVFCLANLLVFSRHWLLWHSLLGEIPAAGCLLMGHWLLSDERLSRRAVLAAGLFLGLAVQTKYLAAMLCGGACVILAMRLCAGRWSWKARAVRAALFFLGCLAPTALWEAYKLYCLGCRGYLVNWRQFLDATHALTVKGPRPFSLELVRERFATAIDQFSINLAVWAMILVMILYLFRKGLTGRWPCLFIGLLVSSVCGVVYWGCFSMGWPRYAAMAVVLACFALSLPVFGLPRVGQQALLALVALLALIPAAPYIPMVWEMHQYALFRPSKFRQARADAVAAIEALRRQGPIDLVSRNPGEFCDVDFNLDGCRNFNRAISEDSRSNSGGLSRRRIVLINDYWGPQCFTFFAGNERDKIERLLGETIVAALFMDGPYELVETGGPAPAARVSRPRPAGAFISATPNPAPAGAGSASSLIAWDTGDGASGEVVQAVRDTPLAEQPFANGPRGTKEATWLTAGIAYEFRLYAGPGRKRLLDSVRVTRKCQ